jgi:hypothetical protein
MIVCDQKRRPNKALERQRPCVNMVRSRSSRDARPRRCHLHARSARPGGLVPAMRHQHSGEGIYRRLWGVHLHTSASAAAHRRGSSDRDRDLSVDRPDHPFRGRHGMSRFPPGAGVRFLCPPGQVPERIRRPTLGRRRPQDRQGAPEMGLLRGLGALPAQQPARGRRS